MFILLMGEPDCESIQANEADRIQFALKLEFWSRPQGLNTIDPSLAQRGPPRIGTKKANLDPVVDHIIKEFGAIDAMISEAHGECAVIQTLLYEKANQKVLPYNMTVAEFTDHISKLRNMATIAATGGIPRPQLDLKAQTFANIFNQVFGFKLTPPFDPYLNTINYLLASNSIPYVGFVGYVGTIPVFKSSYFRRLVAGLLGVEAGQDAVLRALLYERANEKVMPYDITVAEFISLRKGLVLQITDATLAAAVQS
ncbi:desiccation-related protein pcc13-62 [Quercus suber]|uniref:Desiccation-related protein pcc13-62 n=1 Tax=Quercus suber TaxID=58331 RepID=A0AAW0JAU4_QUESU